MGLFDRNSKRTSVANTSLTDIDTTNTQITDQSATGKNRIDNVSGGVVIQDGSREAITLAGQASNNATLLAGSIANAAGAAVSSIAASSAAQVKDSQDFASDINANSLETVTGITERSFDNAEKSLDILASTGSKALDTLADQSKNTTGFLTTLTDNVLARDAVQNIAARTEGSLNEALRAIEGVGTTGSQNTTKQRNLIIGGVIAVAAAMFIFGRKKAA
tara:strand:+ start:6520 stop:7179 length:660 start_codon:yes stop_codon:yes gene_type:complete